MLIKCGIALLMSAVIVLVIGPCIVLYWMDELTWRKYRKFYQILFK